jgi:carboxyl-terminal processing protease
MKKLIIVLSIILSIFSSCKKDDPVPGVTPEMARDTLYFIMKDWYYWYNLMPSVTRGNYADPYTLLDAMRYKELDRWSFVADYDEFMAEMRGEFVGHGIRIGLDNSNKARIAMIYKNSPLYTSKVRRGWMIKTVNGYDLSAIMLAGNSDAYDEALGPGNEGVTNVFVFARDGKADTTITSAKKKFIINSVLLYDTIKLSSGIIAGHLVLESFIEPTDDELQVAFAFFKNNNVKDIILDLRYNTGGFLDASQLLASYIAGNGFTTTTYARLDYNNKRQDYNQTYPFVTTQYPIAATKLVVITTRSTASASEAVMNGLSPIINFVSVGDTTNGKPTGMNGWECGKKYFFWPITFKIVNSSNEGDYFDGFPPDKIAIDDITHDFDSRDEECLNEAIRFLETGSFSGPGKSIRSFTRSVHYSEKPSWMNNTFVLKK